jgi:16S rRNA (guanine(1405)-N(7))-methyltransferase
VTPREVAEELRAARKYRSVCEDTLERVAAWALERYPSGSAVKEAKRKLHQVYGAYFDRVDWNRIEAAVAGLATHADEDELRSVCLSILESHASTRERLPYFETVWDAIFAELDNPRVVLDLACGLNPFSLPWRHMPEDGAYHAADIDTRLCGLLLGFFAAQGLPHSASCVDLMVHPPSVRADAVLLLKVLPCLEQQEKGASKKLLDTLQARAFVLSFPTKSLGGRDKGMARHYDDFVSALLEGRACRVSRFEIGLEAFYVVKGTQLEEP